MAGTFIGPSFYGKPMLCLSFVKLMLFLKLPCAATSRNINSILPFFVYHVYPISLSYISLFTHHIFHSIRHLSSHLRLKKKKKWKLSHNPAVFFFYSLHHFLLHSLFPIPMTGLPWRVARYGAKVTRNLLG